MKVPHSLLDEPDITLAAAAARVADKQNLKVSDARAALLTTARKLNRHLDWTT